MNKYRVYLTMSPEVAGLIAKAHKLGEDGVCEIRHGSAMEVAVIPKIYKDAGFYQCTITYNENAPVKPYELIIA